MPLWLIGLLFPAGYAAYLASKNLPRKYSVSRVTPLASKSNAQLADDLVGSVRGREPRGYSLPDFRAEIDSIIDSIFGGSRMNNSTVPPWIAKDGPAVASRYQTYAAEIAAAERQYGMPPGLLARQLQKESRFNPKAYNRDSGAMGIAQFLRNTAIWMGVADPYNPGQAIPGAARYMRYLYNKFGSWRLALAAYNWGEGNLAKKGLARAPAETRDYLDWITKAVPVS